LQDTNKSAKQNVKDHFLLNVALATSELDELVAKGPIDFDGFVREFREFDWSGEVIREYWSKKLTPSMAVTNKSGGSTLWTSAYDWHRLLNPSAGPAHKPAISFTVGLNNGPTPPDIYCRKEDRNLVDCEFGAESPQVVEELFSLYFLERYNELYKRLFNLTVFNSRDSY